MRPERDEGGLRKTEDSSDGRRWSESDGGGLRKIE